LNPTATRLFGYDPDEMVGESIRRLIPIDRQDEEDQILAKIRAGDDEVRDVTLKRLELLGYTVTEARTGPEALERLTLQEGVRLVLSDVLMPGGMTGYDVARWGASNKPDVKVIMCSGYNERERAIDAQQERVTTLRKPYTRDHLARALSNAFAP
jgi:two-component system, chemotaxis family, CheB/CheR fusion protein